MNRRQRNLVNLAVAASLLSLVFAAIRMLESGHRSANGRVGTEAKARTGTAIPNIHARHSLLLPSQHPDYAQSIRSAQRAAGAGNYRKADDILGRLHRTYPQNQEVLAVALQMQCARHQYQEYERFVRNEGRARPIPEMKHALRVCRNDLALDGAQRLLGQGDAVGAIRIAAPLYASGPDPYRAGLILARAYVANHEEPRAAQLYSELARRYPRDPGLARQAVLASVHARRYQDARSIYATLPRTQQRSVLADLDSNYDLIYPDSIAILVGRAHASGIAPSEDYYEGLRAKLALASGTLVGDAIRAHRFGENADSYGANYYFRIGHGYSGECAVSYSPSNTFLAHESAAFALTKDYRYYALYGGVRRLVFSTVSANVFFGGVALDVNRKLTIRTGIYYVPQTSAYSYLFAPQWTQDGNKTFLYLTAGMAGEQLNVSGAILRTPSDSVKLGRIQQITSTIALEGDVFYEHRSGLYDRSGVDVSLIKRW